MQPTECAICSVRSYRGHFCHGAGAVRARCKFWVYPGTPLIIATIKRLQKRTKTTQKPLGLIGN